VGRVELFPPRPIAQSDVEYLVWISGATGSESEPIRLWAVTLISLGSAWVDAHFDSLREPAAEYVHVFLGPDGRRNDYAARANMLRSLMRQRDDRAAMLFDQERDLLRSMLDRAKVEPAAQDAVVESVMDARIADAIDGDALLFSPHLAPSILRLFHAATINSGVDEDTGLAIRQFALDHAPRILERRRIVLDACLRSAHRSLAAMASAHSRGEPVRGASASAFRPIATGATSVAALNREVLAAARSGLAAEVPDDLVDAIEVAFLHQVYGPIAADLHALDDLQLKLLRHLEEPALSTAIALLADDRRNRVSSRDHLLQAFDRTHRRYLERGLGHLPEDRSRFLDELSKHIDSGGHRAAITIGAIRELAMSSPEWEPDDFEEASRGWHAAVQRRISEMNAALTAYGLAPPQSTDRLPHAGTP
jgi:hypothetical protein